MACNCNSAKKKDFEYIKKMAIALSKMDETDVQIYHYTLRGVGKVYDFERYDEARPQVVEVIRFHKPESDNILSDSIDTELPIAEPDGHKGKRRRIIKPVVQHIGTVLPED